jgi:L-malate glycosyltransferase
MAESTTQMEILAPTDSSSRNGAASGLAERTVVDAPASQRRHVLFLIDQLCEPGGAERALLNMIRLLPEDRFRVSLATFKLDSRVELFRKIPCPIHVFPLRRTYGWTGLVTARKIRTLIRSEHVDIVHTFFETSDLWGGLVAKLSGRILLISSRRDMGILRGNMHRLAYRVMGRLYDLVVTVSEEVRSYCVKEDRLDPPKVVTLYNGIELDKIRASHGIDGLRDSLGLTKASHLITTVGHIRKIKGVDIFIRAAAVVRREFPAAAFLIIGNGDEPQHLQDLHELTRSLGLTETVRFLGTSEKVFSLLKMSDAFVLPSRSEGFSNALLEAMACGLPCVATKVGGNAEAIEDDVSGFIVPPEDPETMAERILTLLRNPAKARLMGQAAAAVVQERFTAPAMIARLVGIYSGLLETKNA